MHIKNKVTLISTSFKNSSIDVKKCLDSVIGQTYKNIEILVVLPPFSNNYNLIKKYSQKYKNIKIIKTQKLLNIGSSLNIALKKSVGEFIARFDFDDVYHASRISNQVNFMKKNLEVDFCSTNAKILYKNKLFYKNYPINNLFFFIYLFFRNPIFHPCVMFRSSKIRNKFFYNEALNFSEDLDLWIRLLIKGKKFKNISKYLVIYKKKTIIRNKKNFYYNYLIRKKYAKKIYGNILGQLNIFIYKLIFVELFNFSSKIFKLIMRKNDFR